MEYGQLFGAYSGENIQIGVYRGDGIMYFSFRGERKVPKESPLKESTQVLSLRILSPVRRALLPGGKRALCAVTSRVAGGPQPRRSAELAGLAYSRGCASSFLFLLRVSGEVSADGAPPFVRAIGYPRPSAQSDSFATPMAKGSRGDGGFLKGGLHASLKWRSFGTFLSTGREKYIIPSPRQTQICSQWDLKKGEGKRVSLSPSSLTGYRRYGRRHRPDRERCRHGR